MSPLIDSNTRLLVQGITGREASMVTRHMIDYGTNVVAGVTPGRGGLTVEGIEVYDLVAQAVEKHKPNATLISVPPAATLDAVAEAAHNQIPLIVIATEGVPQHDVVRFLEATSDAGSIVIGPNSVGVINPEARVKVGAIGGANPERSFIPGPVGILSRSGGMTAEIGLMLRLAGIGVSTAISVGGDALLGSSPARLLETFEQDAATQAVVLFGEPGTRFEEEVARALEAGRFTKPLVALIAGSFTESLPTGTAFGHAAAIIEGDSGKPSAKRSALGSAGAQVAADLDQLVDLVRQSIDR